MCRHSDLLYQFWLALEFWCHGCDEKHDQEGTERVERSAADGADCGQKMHIDNTEFSLLEASENFMATVLLLASGVITDRLGGAGMYSWGKATSGSFSSP